MWEQLYTLDSEKKKKWHYISMQATQPMQELLNVPSQK